MLPFGMIQIKKLLIILGLATFSLPMVIFFPNEGTSDMGVWLEWTSHIDRWGPLNAYSIINTDPNYENTDYPPLSFLNLWLALKAAATGNVSWMLGIKFILLVYYLATWAAIIFLSTLIKKRSIGTNILISSGLFLVSLYFVVNSQALGYLDITYAPYIVVSILLFAKRQYFLSGVLLTIAILIKWIVVLMIPAFLFYFINKKGRRYRFGHFPMLKFFGGVVLVAGLLLVVLLLNNISLLSLVESLRKALIRTSSTLSPGALNFNLIIGYIVELLYPDNYQVVIRNNYQFFQSFSAAIFLAIIILILKNFLKVKKDMHSFLQTSLMVTWSYFIWRTGVHENHLFITVLTALCLAVLGTNWSNIRQYLFLAFFGLANFFVYFGFPIREGSILIPDSFKVILGIKITVVLAAFHVLIFLIYFKKFLRGSFRNADR